MIEIWNWIKKVWEYLNKIHPQTRSLLILLLFGYILYSQITRTTEHMIHDSFQQEAVANKNAEKYSMETAIELNHQVQLIAEKDKDAFDVILLNYHNNTQSLQGYKYLYLSCLTEATRCLDTPLMKNQWNKIDYIYYADELAKIHSQGFIQFGDLEQMGDKLPKLYRLIRASGAEAVTFFTIEGHNAPIGLVVLFYNESKKYDYAYAQGILPCIQKLAILLDYENNKK